MACPETLWIEYEPYDWGRFQQIGRDRDGNQFMAFVTGAFPKENQYPDPAGNWMEIKRWYAVLHRFDPQGFHLESRVWNGGTTADGQETAIGLANQKLEKMLSDLGVESYGDIVIRPFSYENDGYVFELSYVYEEDDEIEEEDRESLMLMPNDIMFHPPWDGEYST